MKIMYIFYIIFSLLLFYKCYAQLTADNYFCRNLRNRQNTIDVNQLQGVWYLIEKVIHVNKHLKVNLTTCPTFRIDGEDNSLYSGGYSSGINYGQNYPHYRSHFDNNYDYQTEEPLNPTDPKFKFENKQDFIDKIEQYDKKTTYDWPRRSLGYHSLIDKRFNTRKLKITIDDGFNQPLIYHIRFDSNDSGKWIIEDENLNEAYGTSSNIYVIKAVGSHLILTLCKSDPSKEVFTWILVRDNGNQKDNSIINMAHPIINSLGFGTSFVEKTCNQANGFNQSIITVKLLIFLIIIIKKIIY